MGLIFKYEGIHYRAEFDEECNCGNDKCAFFDRDCDELQEEGMIPMCLKSYNSIKDCYFVRVDHD